MATKKTANPDLAKLTDDDLIALIVSARKEAQRRGLEAEAEVWAAALADDEATRVAREAAEAEARRLREEEQRRVAREAAERVRREAEEARAREERDKAQAAAAKLRAIAVRARELFGSDSAAFDVKIWERTGDKRLYIGHGYDANWVEYYHTGNARTAPGTICFPAANVRRDLANHLGITPEEAGERIKAFCAEICTKWTSLTVEVNESNAPRDPACRQEGEWVVWDGDSRQPYYMRKDGTVGRDSSGEGRARFASREEAEAARAAANRADYKVKQVVTWLAFPPKVAPAGSDPTPAAATGPAAGPLDPEVAALVEKYGTSERAWEAEDEAACFRLRAAGF